MTTNTVLVVVAIGLALLAIHIARQPMNGSMPMAQPAPSAGDLMGNKASYQDIIKGCPGTGMLC
jgi:hypothetical protein